MATTVLRGAHLSLQQDRLWFFQQGSKTYRSQCTVLLQGTLNQQAFQHALQQLVGQYTLFQTVFYALPGMDVPIQVLGHRMEISCSIISLENLKEPQQVLAALCMQLQEKPFDLAHGPLFRTVLFRFSTEEHLEQTHWLHISLPALYADTATLPLLLTALVKRYNVILAGQELDVEPLQYTAVSSWQKQLFLQEDGEAKTAREFWKTFTQSQLALVQQRLLQANLIKQSNLQATEPPVFEPLTLPIMLEETLSTHVHALSSRTELSIAAIFLASFLIILWRFTGEAQLCLGVACDGRNDEALAEVLGLSTRFVPFHGYTQDDWTFEQVVTFVERSLQTTRQHQLYFCWPEASDKDNGTACSSFFPVTFEHEVWPASFPATQVNLSLSERWCCTEPFLLKLSVLQIGARLQLELSYDPVLVVATCVPRLASLLHVFLQSGVERPQAQVGALPLLTADERNHLLTLSRAPVCSLPAQGWHRLFEAQAERTPAQLAVICSSGQAQGKVPISGTAPTRTWMTYQELNERANRLAQVLRGRGVGPNILVGLYMARHTQMLVGLLGVLKAGGAYLPLDVGSPSARLTHQLQESQVALLLTQQELSLHLPTWEGQTLCLEDLESEMAQAEAKNLIGGNEAEDLAYVIYTSGSTGMPKGVMIRHQSLVNYTRAMCEKLQTEPGWQYATVSTLAADLGNTAIFCALASGGCVQVLDYETVTSVEAMTKWARQHPIDVLKIVPSHLLALLIGEQAQELLPRQALVLGGEVLPVTLLERLQELGGTCQVYNHYGPTEATIGVLVNPLGILGEHVGTGVSLTTNSLSHMEKPLSAPTDHARFLDKPSTVGAESSLPSNDQPATKKPLSVPTKIPPHERQVPLGKPINNVEVYVLDRRMQLMPAGVIGELYVGGAGLSIGYVKLPEQTAESFVPHPFVPHPHVRTEVCGVEKGVIGEHGQGFLHVGKAVSGEGNPCPYGAPSQAGSRLYRTGDLARYTEEGTIEFLGRCDHQVKLRGYRIELAEIEAVIRQHPEVRDSVVVLQEDEPSDGAQLVGYIVPRNPPVPDDMDLGDFLRKHVPEYMVPSTFVYLKFFPLTANGKVKRQQLARARRDDAGLLTEKSLSLIELDSPSRKIVQPRDATEWHLLQIWEEILQRQPLSIFDNFFQLGGHSLLAVRLMSHIAKRFERDIPLAMLFQRPTVATLAAVLRQDRAVAVHTPCREGFYTPPIVAIQTQGNRPPFFCVHPGGGTAFCYVNLARRLGPDQPFYGLQAPEAISQEDDLSTVEALAAHYLAALQTIQPQGPYLLGGWSAGGILAFEMAQQLQRQGQEVSLLALLDTSPPSVQLREKTLKEEIDLEDTGIVKALVYHFKLTVPDDFDQRGLDEQLTYAIEQAKEMQAIPLDTSIALVRRYTRIYILLKHIIHIYTAQTYPHHIDYFASTHCDLVPVAAREQTDRHFQHWRELATGGMTIHLIPGEHQTLVEEPHVQGLANALKACIDRVCEQL